MENQTDITREQLKADFRALADTLDELIEHSGTASKAELEQLRARADSLLKETRGRVEKSSDQALNYSRDAAQRCDKMVRDNPWTSIGIGAAVGVVVGMLLGRRG